jgi:hypothetical protein
MAAADVERQRVASTIATFHAVDELFYSSERAADKAKLKRAADKTTLKYTDAAKKDARLYTVFKVGVMKDVFNYFASVALLAPPAAEGKSYKERVEGVWETKQAELEALLPTEHDKDLFEQVQTWARDTNALQGKLDRTFGATAAPQLKVVDKEKYRPEAVVPPPVEPSPPIPAPKPSPPAPTEAGKQLARQLSNVMAKLAKAATIYRKMVRAGVTDDTLKGALDAPKRARAIKIPDDERRQRADQRTVLAKAVVAAGKALRTLSAQHKTGEIADLITEMKAALK